MTFLQTHIIILRYTKNGVALWMLIGTNVKTLMVLKDGYILEKRLIIIVINNVAIV